MSKIINMAKANPTSVFKTPEDVLRADIADTEKLGILKSWEDEAHQLQAATSENMTGGEPPNLSAIREALDQLEKNIANSSP